MTDAIAQGCRVPGELRGEIVDSTILLERPSDLRARLGKDGYVLLRGVVDQQSVLAAREEVFERLASVGEIEQPAVRGIARELYASVADLPIVSPHGHTDPAWFATNAPFGNATELLLVPDHYLFRMLYSQGVRLEDLGIAGHEADPRAAWRILAENYHLFRGTPSR
ncbi:MAG: glucuronate isomerase, partial [Planctomycetaceae bacterium]